MAHGGVGHAVDVDRLDTERGQGVTSGVSVPAGVAELDVLDAANAWVLVHAALYRTTDGLRWAEVGS